MEILNEVKEKLSILESDYQNVKQIYETSLLLLQEMQSETTDERKLNKYTRWENKIKSELRRLETTVTEERQKLHAIQIEYSK